MVARKTLSNMGMEPKQREMVDLLLRKSKVVREGEHALSLRAQEERGRRWADEQGYTVRKVWKENLSAYSDVERPKYDAAMKAVLDGEVPALWCYALDRFSRKGAEAVVPILGKARVIFDYEGLDSSIERDRRWIIQRAEDAREYSQRLSYNVRSTKARQRNEGRWLSRAPYGLVADKDRKLAPDTALIKGKNFAPWDVVCRIIREISEGVSARALARKLNAEGIKSAAGKTWYAETIRTIVVSPVYEGWLTVRPGHDPIHYITDAGTRIRCVRDDVLPDMIPAELADRARRVLSGHQVIDNTKRTGRAQRLLAGRIRCAGCDGAMVAQGANYQCARHHAGSHCPAPALVQRRAVREYVTDAWLARMGSAEEDDELMIAVAERWTALTRPKESAEIREATATLKAAEATLYKFHEDDRAGFYAGRSAKYRLPAKTEAEARVTAAEERLAELTGGGAINITFLMDGNAPKKWERADDALRRDLIGLAIDRITVCKAPRRGVRFNGHARVTIQWAEAA